MNHYIIIVYIYKCATPVAHFPAVYKLPESMQRCGTIVRASVQQPLHTFQKFYINLSVKRQIFGKCATGVAHSYIYSIRYISKYESFL